MKIDTLISDAENALQDARKIDNYHLYTSESIACSLLALAKIMQAIAAPVIAAQAEAESQREELKEDGKK